MRPRKLIRALQRALKKVSEKDRPNLVIYLNENTDKVILEALTKNGYRYQLAPEKLVGEEHAKILVLPENKSAIGFIRTNNFLPDYSTKTES